MAALSFLDLNNEITPQVMTLLHYFAKDTTERIIMNAGRLIHGDSGALQSSIAATVYNNAGGNDALVRFYYMNYAGFLEEGLGHMWGIDEDLTQKGKRKGVKASNVRPIDPITGSNFGSIPATIRKATRSPKGDQRRGEAHKAKPFLHSEIRLHLRGTQKRLAMLLAYTATAYLTRGMVQATYELVGNAKGMKRNEELRDKVAAAKVADDWRAKDFEGIESNYSGFRFVSDMGAEEAWLKAKGYLRHVEKDWGLSSFSAEMFK